MFSSYCRSNMAKRHFRKIDRKCQIFSVTSPKVQYAYNKWQIMKIQQEATLRWITICSWKHLSIVLHSTDIEVVIMELLEYMVIRSKVNRSLPFIQKFKQEKRPKRWIDGMVYWLIERIKLRVRLKYKSSIRQPNITFMNTKFYQALGFQHFDLSRKRTTSIRLLFINYHFNIDWNTIKNGY